jgi:hypothetical protein
MARAFTTGGRTLLLLVTIYGSTVYAQEGINHHQRGTTPDQEPAPAPATQPAPTPPTAAPQAQPAPPTPQAAPAVAPSMLQQPAQEAQIAFDSGSLSIRADNSSLAVILRQIAAKSGMKVEGLGGDERVFGSFGPGAPRDVLADLLDGTAYNLVLVGDLGNGAPRELILTPASRGSAVAASAPRTNADDESNDQESAEAPPPQPEPQPGTAPPATPGVRTPQQLFEQLQRMRTGQQQQQQQQQQQPVQQDSPLSPQ